MHDDHVFIQCKRMPPEDLEHLKQWLRETDGAEDVFDLHQRSVGDAQTIGVVVAQFLLAYGATKALDHFSDRLSDLKTRKRKDTFTIGLGLGLGTPVREVGPPKRKQPRGKRTKRK